MLSRITKIGTSVGIIIPRYIASEGGFSKGSPVSIEYSDNKITISAIRTPRQGWAEAFSEYVKNGEDAMLLPDFLDSEALELE